MTDRNASGHYNPRAASRDSGSYVVGFGPASLAMTAHGLHRDRATGVITQTSYPVIGFVVVHQVDADGRVTGDAVQPAVFCCEGNEARAVVDYYAETADEVLIGVYPLGAALDHQDVCEALAELTENDRT